MGPTRAGWDGRSDSETINNPYTLPNTFGVWDAKNIYTSTESHCFQPWCQLEVVRIITWVLDWGSLCVLPFSLLIVTSGSEKTSYSRWLQDTIESNRFISTRHKLSEHKPHSMFPRIPVILYLSIARENIGNIPTYFNGRCWMGGSNGSTKKTKPCAICSLVPINLCTYVCKLSLNNVEVPFIEVILQNIYHFGFRHVWSCALGCPDFCIFSKISR